MSIVNVDIGTILSGAGDLVNSIGNQIRGKVPVDLVKLAELEVKMKELQNVIPTLLSEVDKAQAGVNSEEAKSTSIFTSGWRPTVGWICTFALAYHYILMPFIIFIIGLFMTDLPKAPELDIGELLTLLFGLLGLGTLRTVEKFKK